jgi:hypothetical protein
VQAAKFNWQVTRLLLVQVLLLLESTTTTTTMMMMMSPILNLRAEPP